MVPISGDSTTRDLAVAVLQDARQRRGSHPAGRAAAHDENAANAIIHRHAPVYAQCCAMYSSCRGAASAARRIVWRMRCRLAPQSRGVALIDQRIVAFRPYFLAHEHGNPVGGGK